MGLPQEKRTTGGRRFWPVLGFVLIVVISIIAYQVAPDILAWVRSNFRGTGLSDIPREHLKVGVALFVFLVLITLFAAVLSLTAPKKAMNVREGDLAKERNEMLKARAEAKRRQRKINNQMRNQ